MTEQQNNTKAAGVDTHSSWNIRPELAFFAGWLVPGAGHFYIGQKKKAYVFFFSLVLGYMFGAIISSFDCLSWQYHNYAFIAQMGIGSLTLPIVLIKNAYELDPKEFVNVNTLMDPGLLYTQVAGLLNFLVAFDAFENAAVIARKQKSVS